MYRQASPYSDHRIDNFMFIDDDGVNMTRCFDRNGMYTVPTQRAARRPPAKCQLWKVGDDGLGC